MGDGDLVSVISSTEVDTGTAADPHTSFSDIIELLNNRFGTGFTEADRLFFEQIKEGACNDDQVIRTANAKPLDKFKVGIRGLIESLMIQRLEDNGQIVSATWTTKP